MHNTTTHKRTQNEKREGSRKKRNESKENWDNIRTSLPKVNGDQENEKYPKPSTSYLSHSEVQTSRRVNKLEIKQGTMGASENMRGQKDTKQDVASPSFIHLPICLPARPTNSRIANKDLLLPPFLIHDKKTSLIH